MMYDAAPSQGRTRRTRTVIAAAIALSMMATALILGATADPAAAQGLPPIEAETVCFSLDQATGTDQSLFQVDVPAATATNNGLFNAATTGEAESIALLNETGAIYTFDPSTNTFYEIDPATGAGTAIWTDDDLNDDLILSDDIDAMFWVNDQDGNLANDELWMVLDEGTTASLIQINPATGALIGSPILIAVPANESVEGATWLPSTNSVYISHTVTGQAAAPSSLSILNLADGTISGTVPTELDVEGLGTDGEGNLFITTGEDATDSLYQVVPAAAPNTALIIDLGAVGDPVKTDFESVDCAFPEIGLAKRVTDGPTRNGANWDVEYTFVVENTGALPLDNIVLTDPFDLYLNDEDIGDVPDPSITVVNDPPPEVSNDCVVPGDDLLIDATCTITVIVTYAGLLPNTVYYNTATVEGTDPFGQTVTDISQDGPDVDPDNDPNVDPEDDSIRTPIEIPTEPPVLDILKTIVLPGEDCPADFAAALAIPDNPGRDALVVAAGTMVKYCINVINTGLGTATNVSVADPEDPDSPQAPIDGELVSDEEFAFDYEAAATPPSTNTATVTGQDGDGVDIDPVTDVAGVDPAPALEILKTVVTSADDCPATYAEALAVVGNPGEDTIPAQVGDPVVYCINFINNGEGPADGVQVVDAFDPDSPRDFGTVGVGEQAGFAFIFVTTESPQTNTATIQMDDPNGDPGDPKVEVDSDTAGVRPTAQPNLNILKTVVLDAADCPADFAAALAVAGNPGNDTIEAAAGAAVVYCVNVRNTGAGDSINTVVNDTFLDGPTAVGTDGVLAAGAEDLFNYPRTVLASPETNTAVISGQDNDGNDVPTDEDTAGVTPPGGVKIGDFVWEDLNGNGIQDPGEPGIEGISVLVYMVDADGNLIAGLDPVEVVTDADGMWMLEVEPGTYRVLVVIPANAEFTTPDAAGSTDANDSDVAPTGATAGFTDVYTISETDNPTIDAGIIFDDDQTVMIGDFVWLDTNGDGIQDTDEPGVEGVLVQVLDSTGAVVASDTTDANGEWGVDIAPGVYSVQFVNTTIYDFTIQDAAGSTDANDSDVDQGTGVTGTYNVSISNGDDLTIDAGLVELASIGNVVWEDLNENGQLDAGEPGLQGVTVNVYDSAGNLAGTTTTDANGGWLVEDLQPGDYTVEFVDPGGRQLTTANSGDDGFDSDADPTTGITGVYTLAPGEFNETVDAGFVVGPVIGLSKDLTGGPTRNADGTFSMQFSFVIENLGPVALDNIELSDDFASVFAPDASVVSGPVPNAAGDCSTTAATGTATLAVGASCSAVWDVVISAGLIPGKTYNNVATVTGTGPEGVVTSDVADDGTNPDPDGDSRPNEPGENDPTPIVIPSFVTYAPQEPYTGPYTTSQPENVPDPDPVLQIDTPPLAVTGSNANQLAAFAMVMMGAGGLLFVGARRGRDEYDI